MDYKITSIAQLQLYSIRRAGLLYLANADPGLTDAGTDTTISASVKSGPRPCTKYN